MKRENSSQHPPNELMSIFLLRIFMLWPNGIAWKSIKNCLLTISWWLRLCKKLWVGTWVFYSMRKLCKFFHYHDGKFIVKLIKTSWRATLIADKSNDFALYANSSVNMRIYRWCCENVIMTQFHLFSTRDPKVRGFQVPRKIVGGITIQPWWTLCSQIANGWYQQFPCGRKMHSAFN